jgi:hypothetical protein
MKPAWPWGVLALLGAYHGLNPAMGWLFALALGLQERSRSAVVRALWPIALGHAAAITVALVVLAFAQRLLPAHALRWPVSAIIFALGVYRLFRARHPAGMGMRVTGRELFGWSFLMASAHGAGLMLIPVLLARPMVGMNHFVTDPVHGDGMALSPSVLAASVLVHTLSMLMVAGILAIVSFEFYEVAGIKFLRDTWLNFDLLWAFALLIAAGAVLIQ